VLFLLVAVFKTVLNVGALRLLGQPWPVAFLSGVVMAQIGEFSFLLALQGVGHGVIDREDSRLIVAVAVLSLVLSPLWMVTARRLRALAHRGTTEASELLRLLYGREAEFCVETFDGARSHLRRWAWRVGEWRRQRQAAGIAVEGTPEPPTRGTGKGGNGSGNARLPS
jgi:CPA2 family monovalent cation:H+ antiporter-2